MTTQMSQMSGMSASWQSLDEIDVFTPDRYVEGVPHEAFRRLRAEAPVHFHREPHGRGYWAITKYRDIIQISRDPQTFSSARGATFIQDYPEDGEELTVLRLFLLNMDPPQHVKYRNIVRHGFIPRMIAALEPKIRERVKLILDEAGARGRVDFVHDVSARLPIEVIADMIGVPREDREHVFELSTRMVTSIEPNDDPDAEDVRADGKACAMMILEYAGELARRRFEEPGDDLMSMLLHGVQDGALDAMEFAVFFMLLVVAGYETTRNGISSGMLQLLYRPQEYSRLVADPSLIPTAVDEMLRFDSPIVYFRRTAMRDVELRGRRINEGDKVALYYVSANRDEEVFEAPDTFDVARRPNDHLAFGIGQHICLGATLARLEMRIFFEELLARFPRIRLDGTPLRWRSNFMNGLREMPVVLE